MITTLRAVRLTFLPLLCLAAPWAIGASAARADADDIVFMKNGGRVRGVVIESDPATGVRLKRYDGTIRVIEAAAIDHITYGGSPQQPITAKPVASPRRPAPQPIAAPEPRHEAAQLAYHSSQGALRIESTEPGEVSIEGGEYGSTPLVIPNLSAGTHRVTIRFHAGDSDARVVNVRGGAETLVRFATTGSLRAYRAHRAWRFGLGLEGGFSMFDENDGAAEVHLLVRANYAVSRVVELHADARLGVFAAMLLSTHINTQGLYTASATPGLLLGGDVQLNVGSVYTMSIGVDAGALIGVGPVVGAHISPIGFRVGSERATLLALQAGVMSGNESAAATFLLSVTYLFL